MVSRSLVEFSSNLSTLFLYSKPTTLMERHTKLRIVASVRMLKAQRVPETLLIINFCKGISLLDFQSVRAITLRNLSSIEKAISQG